MLCMFTIYTGLLSLTAVIVTGQCLTCLNCPSITHPRFCRHVKKCQQGELCGLKRLADEFEDIKYRLGCMQQNECKTHSLKRNLNDMAEPTAFTTCTHCCNTDLCNTEGCGETDISHQTSNVCYKCDGLAKGDKCTIITYCADSEQCYIQERTRYQEPFYESGCMDKQVCQSTGVPAFGRRSVKRSQEQLSCCSSNLCNQNTSVTSGNGHQNPHSTNYTDSTGHEFVLIFPQHSHPDIAQPHALIASQSNGVVFKYSFSSHFNTSDKLSSSSYALHFDRNITIPKDGQFLKGVELETTSRASVYGFIYCNFTNERFSEGYLAIPKKYLSKKYIVPTYKYGYDINVITVASIVPNTIVNVYQKHNGADSVYKNFVLRKDETLQISGAYDFSGTLVTSTEPVAIVSGSINNHIKIAYNPMLEMVLPTSQWDRSYIIPDIATRPNRIVRVYSNKLTNVSVHHNDKLEIKEIKERGFVEFDHTALSFINASQDVMVMIFPVSLADGSGDNFMMTIHGMNQYLSEYEFAVPQGFTSFISVTVSSQYVTGFILDGKPMHHENASHIFGGPAHYSTFTRSIHSGVHTITQSSNVKFGLWVYGNGPKDGYGYPAGIGFRSVPDV